jgi:uncharacterized protein (DUF362 family)
MYKVAISTSADYSSEAVNNAVDKLFDFLGFNIKNPFESFIKPGMTVFIKPNWVASRWRESCSHKDTLYSVITHPSVIEAVADRVAAALQGSGKIIIGDNPSLDADFEELMTFTNIRKLSDKYNVPCEIMDLRPLVCKDLADYGIKSKMHIQSGDTVGNVEVNLAKESLLYDVDSSLFRGVFNEREETVNSHTGDTQLYTFSKSLYNADVYISIPKLKTHQKVGATLNLKGLVGSITNKNQLVHWRVGSPETGGDEYPNREQFEVAQKAKLTHRGAHPGNDTIWRMVVDLYNAMQKKERKYFTVIDGIIAGEGQGPFCPNSKHTHTLLASENLLAADIAATRLMGLNPRKIKYLEHFINNGYIDLDDIVIKSDIYSENGFFQSDSAYLDFKVVDQWKGIKV